MDILQDDIYLDLKNQKVPTFNSSYIKTETYPLSEVLTRISSGYIRLMKIDGQEKPRWTEQQQELFFTSVVHGLPIPLMYVNSEEEGTTVIDGFERLVALNAFCKGDSCLDIRLQGEKVLGADELSVSIRKKLLSTPIQLCSLTQKMPMFLRYHVFQWLNASGHYSLDRSYKRLVNVAHKQLIDRFHAMYLMVTDLDVDVLVQTLAHARFSDPEKGNLGGSKNSVCWVYDGLRTLDSHWLAEGMKRMQRDIIAKVAGLFPSQKRSKRMMLAYYLLFNSKALRQKHRDLKEVLSGCLADKEFSKLPADIFAISHYLQSHDLL